MLLSFRIAPLNLEPWLQLEKNDGKEYTCKFDIMYARGDQVPSCNISTRTPVSSFLDPDCTILH